jgi:mannose-6-phosphate isomerase-like protein (cupin superfamily)
MTTDTSSKMTGARIVHADLPISRSPSGLPIQHLVDSRAGSRSTYVGQQWLQPGERVLLHTHPVEEVLTFLSGEGEATLGSAIVPIGAGVSLYIPAEAEHGFHNTGNDVLHVIVIFPVPHFAETTLVETNEPG